MSNFAARKDQNWRTAEQARRPAERRRLSGSLAPPVGRSTSVYLLLYWPGSWPDPSTIGRASLGVSVQATCPQAAVAARKSTDCRGAHPLDRRGTCRPLFVSHTLA